MPRVCKLLLPLGLLFAAEARPAFGPFEDLTAFLRRGSSRTEPPRCNPPDYTSLPIANCRRCQETVTKWKRELPELASQVQAQEGLLGGAGGLDILGIGGRDGGSNRGSLASGTNVQSRGRDLQGQRRDLARGTQGKLEKCRREIAESCRNIAPGDQREAQKMHDLCENGGDKAGNIANQKQKDSSGMGDLSKALDAATKAMGAASQLAAMQNQGNESASELAGATSPTPDPVKAAEKPEIATAKLNGDQLAASTVSFGGKADSKEPAQSGGGVVASGTAESFGSSGEFESASLGSPATAGGYSPAKSPGGGDSGSGGFNSSGASRPFDGAKSGSPEAGGTYEVPPGGGGRAIVGLKPSKGDLADVAEGAAPTLDASKLDSLGNRDPASEGGALAGAEDPNDSSGESIFRRVRSKYAVLKGAGRI